MVLKHRDTEVLRFDWLEPDGVRITSVNEKALRFLPLEMHGEATDGIVLYKSGSENFANAGFEPYSEFYSAQIAEALGYAHVSYGLEKFKGRICSTCPLFTSEKIGFVPAGRVVSESKAEVRFGARLWISRQKDVFSLSALGASRAGRSFAEGTGNS